eukprot:gene7244-12928_t
MAVLVPNFKLKNSQLSRLQFVLRDYSHCVATTKRRDCVSSSNEMIAARGVRVVRGEGWSYNDQDGGEGTVGTIIHVRSDLQRLLVTVIWDSGLKGFYEIDDKRPGTIVAHDARQSGEKHNCKCYECSEVIIGTIWNCLICTSIVLCVTCYMNNKHELAHPFRRKSGHKGCWVSLPERINSTEVMSKGLFPGATVECTSTLRQTVLRSTFQSLDDNFGRIINYESCIGNSLSAVCVVWNQSLKKTVYQLGRDGKVELRCTVAGYGPTFYKGHLPKIVKPPEINTRSRGYTTSQIPLHRSLQYSSLQACQTSYVKPEDDVYENRNANFYSHVLSSQGASGQGQMTGNHRYTKSSTVDTKSFKVASENNNKAIERFAEVSSNLNRSSTPMQDDWRLSSKQPSSRIDQCGSKIPRGGRSNNEAQCVKALCSYNDGLEFRESEATRSSTCPNTFAVGETVILKSPDKHVLGLPLNQISQQQTSSRQSAVRCTGEDCDQGSKQDKGNTILTKFNVVEDINGRHVMFDKGLSDDSVGQRDCQRSTGASSLSENSDDVGQRQSDVTRCCLCQENECDVRFDPCGHLVSCSGCANELNCLEGGLLIRLTLFNSQDCCLDLKHCVECKKEIAEKIGADGNKIKVEQRRWQSLENLLSSVDRLRSKVMTLESKSKCQICSVNNKDVFFQCGHATCEVCGEKLIVCPTCHVKIEVKTLHGL